MSSQIKIAVVIPSYRVTQQILGVLESIGNEVRSIYVVDDACPDGSGNLVKQKCPDKRVQVLFNKTNLGVGGATIKGYRQAIDDGMDIIVKLDGDGQMDPGQIQDLTLPILEGEADYTKGNRFWDIAELSKMPRARLLGNSILSFFSKASSGYWNLFDPTNGFTAIHTDLLRELPLDKLDERYFFESDMLFRLNLARAVVTDIPVSVRYGDEKSNLKIIRVVLPFLKGHIKNFIKRVLYNYFLRDFSIASIEMVIGILLVGTGVIFGFVEWMASIASGEPATAGTVMLAALPLILGLQLLLSALNYDIQNVPTVPRVSQKLKRLAAFRE